MDSTLCMFYILIKSYLSTQRLSVVLHANVLQGKYSSNKHSYLYYLLAYIYYGTFRLSASCIHVSRLLHALAALVPTQLPPLTATGYSASTEKSEVNLHVTSYPCQWKAPRKRKQSNLQMADASFVKHIMYDKAASSKKRQIFFVHWIYNTSCVPRL